MPVPPPPLHARITDGDGRLNVEWNRHFEALSREAGAELEALAKRIGSFESPLPGEPTSDSLSVLLAALTVRVTALEESQMAIRGDEWARVALPQGVPPGRYLNIAAVPTRQPSAPPELTVHAGVGGNVRLSLAWSPPAAWIGFWLVPFIGANEYPGRQIATHWGDGRYVHFNNTRAPATYYGVHVIPRLNEVAKYSEILFEKHGEGIGLPADASLRIYPAFG